MAIPAFDTYVAAKTLRTAGFNEKQTEAAVTVIREAVAESSATSATKEGQDRLQANQDKLRADMQAGHDRLQADQDKLRAEMQAGLDRLQVNQDKLRADMQAGHDRLQAGLDKLNTNMMRMVLAFAALMLTGFGAVVALLLQLLQRLP